MYKTTLETVTGLSSQPHIKMKCSCGEIIRIFKRAETREIDQWERGHLQLHKDNRPPAQLGDDLCHSKNDAPKRGPASASCCWKDSNSATPASAHSSARGKASRRKRMVIIHEPGI